MSHAPLAVPVDGATLRAARSGQGPPVVLIGGGGLLDCRMWDDQVAAFDGRYDVVRYDPRGIGASDAPSGPFSHVEDLRQVIRHLRLERPVLVGASFSGRVALDYALQYPDDVRALVLEAPGMSGYAFSAEYMAALGELAATAQRDGVARAVDLMVADTSFAPVERAGACDRMRRILLDNARVFDGFSFAVLDQPISPPAVERLETLRMPVLLLAGDRDQAEHLRVIDLAASRVPGASTHVIRGAGHLANLERPEAFNQATLAFLDGLPRGAGE